MTGLVIGNYRIIERLGNGGQGKVYRALDTMVEREVAIKALRPEIARDPQALERFRTEAVTLAKLNHPSIAQLYTFFRDGEDFYMVMEYVPGRTLESMIQEQGRMPWPNAARFVVSILEGVGFAHSMGILHRDIKPANIMVTPDGRVKIMDFGIARALGGGPRLTREGRVVGTVEYLAPERIRGTPPDGRADLYSVGVMLYEMITGRLPFQANEEYAIMMAQLDQTPPSLKQLGIDVPEPLESSLMIALSKNPERRYADTASFAAALELLVPKTATGAQQLPPVKGVSTRPNWFANTTVRLTAAGIGALALVAGVTIAVLGRSTEDPWKTPPPVPAQEAPAPSSPRPAAPPMVIEPTPITIPSTPPQKAPGARQKETSAAPAPAPAPPKPTRPERTEAVGSRSLNAEDRQMMLAALERTDGPAGGASGVHPIHLVGLLGALTLGGREACGELQAHVSVRGVNFKLTPDTAESLGAMGATKELLQAVNVSYRGPAPSPAVAAEPPPPTVVPRHSEPPPPTRAVGSMRDIHTLYIEKLDDAFDDDIRAEINDKLGARLSIGPSPSKADAILQVSIENLKGGTISRASRLFGMSDKHRVQARVLDAATKRVLWEEEVGDRKLLTGPVTGDGLKRIAARVVKALQEQLR